MVAEAEEKRSAASGEIEDVVAGLARAIRIASEHKLQEVVEHIAPALEMLTQVQLGISALSSSKQRTLKRMAVLEEQLANCDAGSRATYIMDHLDLTKSTYYEYRKLLIREGLIPNESEVSGLTTEAEQPAC